MAQAQIHVSASAEPDYAPRYPRSVVWQKGGGPLWIETQIRGRNRVRCDDGTRVYRGIIVYMEVQKDQPINPGTAMYHTALDDPEGFTLQQLADLHGLNGMKPPVVRFYIPSYNGGGKPPFKPMAEVDWASCGLELAPGASATLAGEGHSVALLAHLAATLTLAGNGMQQASSCNRQDRASSSSSSSGSGSRMIKGGFSRTRRSSGSCRRRTSSSRRSRQVSRQR
jgi:hypothetical protein